MTELAITKLPLIRKVNLLRGGNIINLSQYEVSASKMRLLRSLPLSYEKRDLQMGQTNPFRTTPTIKYNL